MTKVHLAVAYPSRYGPGKIHILTRESSYTYTLCGRAPHAEYRTGRADEATCRLCNPSAERLSSAAASRLPTDAEIKESR